MSGGDDFAALSRRLKEAGETGLARALRKAIKDAAAPIASEISNLGHLKPYMPDRYAETLAGDIKVTTLQRGSIRSPGIRIEASGRARKRKVAQLNDGVITHPLFGDREEWFHQLRGMKAGFFDDPCNRAGPQVRDKILKAMHETAAKVTGP
ncbi:MAG TPA: hypothetical protein VK586_16795 [Streptosporangiaceae bacterium]|nr:hypothetical protein [Streptosporangiaceae bacterium]